MQQEPNQGMPQQININPEDTTGVTCGKCNSELFMPMYLLRKVSALISPTGREETIQVPVMVCGNCGQPMMGDQPMPEGAGEVNTEGDGSTLVGADGAPIGEKAE